MAEFVEAETRIAGRRPAIGCSTEVAALREAS